MAPPASASRRIDQPGFCGAGDLLHTAPDLPLHLRRDLLAPVSQVHQNFIVVQLRQPGLHGSVPPICTFV